MARETRLIDDVDGSTDDVRTVCVVVGDDAYEIDLGPASRRKLLDPLLRRARRADGVTERPNMETSAAIRRWAKANGIVVGARGGIPGEVVDAYRAAMRK